MGERRPGVERTRQAEEDLLEAATEIGVQNIQASLRFIEAVECALLRLGSMPELGTLREYRRKRLAGLRMWPVPGFHMYLIFYRPRRRGIQLVRVLHGARDIKRIFDG